MLAEAGLLALFLPQQVLVAEGCVVSAVRVACVSGQPRLRPDQRTDEADSRQRWLRLLEPAGQLGEQLAACSARPTVFGVPGACVRSCTDVRLARLHINNERAARKAKQTLPSPRSPARRREPGQATPASQKPPGRRQTQKHVARTREPQTPPRSPRTRRADLQAQLDPPRQDLRDRQQGPPVYARPQQT